MKKYLIIALLIGFSGSLLNAAVEDPPMFIRGIRPLGMGGAFTALADDQNAVFYNPAGLTQREGSLLTAFEFPVTVSQDFLEFYDFFDSNQDNLEQFDDLTPAKQAALIREINNDVSKLSNRFSLGPQVNYMSGPGMFNWGVGVYTNVNSSFRLRMDMVTPALDIAAYGDLALMIPVAFGFKDLSIPYFPGKSVPLPGKLSVGANYKSLMRMAIVEKRYDVTMMDSFDPLPQVGTGWELDIASLYELNSALTFGLMISDITRNKIVYPYTSKTNTADDGTVSITEKQSYVASIRSRVNVGVAYRPQKFYYLPLPGKYFKSGNRLVLTADLRDVLDSRSKLMGETFWTKVHLGAEYSIMLFNIRGGINQGYPTIGLGVNLFALKLDYAYYTDELGRYAGQRPESNHMVSFALRFGSGSGRSKDQAKKKKDQKILQAKAN